MTSLLSSGKFFIWWHSLFNITVDAASLIYAPPTILFSYWILYYMHGIVINHNRLWTLQWWHDGILNQEGKKSGCCCLYCFSYFPFAMCHVSVSYHNDNVTDHVAVACCAQYNSCKTKKLSLHSFGTLKIRVLYFKHKRIFVFRN